MSKAILTGIEYVNYVSKKTNERVEGYRLSYIRLITRDNFAGMQSEVALWVNKKSRFFEVVQSVMPGDPVEIVLEADDYGRNNLAVFRPNGEKPLIDFEEVIKCMES